MINIFRSNPTLVSIPNLQTLLSRTPKPEVTTFPPPRTDGKEYPFEVIQGDETMFYQDLKNHKGGAKTEQVLPRFYQNHRDIYDFVVIFVEGAKVNSSTTNHHALKTNGLGYGNHPVGKVTKASDKYKRLLGYVRMYDITDTTYLPDSKLSTYNVIVHELGHQWLVHLSTTPLAILTDRTVSSHWSNNFDVGDDPMGQSARLQSLGNNRFYRTYYRRSYQFSWLSLYLMGMARTDEVPPHLFIENAAYANDVTAEEKSTLPQHASVLTGIPRFITALDFIEAFGPRTPAYDGTVINYNVGFILLLRSSREPTQEEITRLLNVARYEPDTWYHATRGRSTINKSPDIANNF